MAFDSPPEHRKLLKRGRRLARRIMERTRLIGGYHRWLERRIARQPGEQIDDGRPMPPRELIVAVSGGAGERWFSERGQADARRFIGLAEAHGLKNSGPVSVLDFGCGSGRIARWVAKDILARGGTFTGSDLNPSLIEWCSQNLDGAYTTNRLKPPLQFADKSFDLIYAHSVLTHLTEKVAMAWLREIKRVLRPGGLAILTFHDEAYAEAWGPAEVKAALGPQPYVVWNNALEGSNYMSAWTTREHFSELASSQFVVREIIAGGRDLPEQAIGVLQRQE